MALAQGPHDRMWSDVAEQSVVTGAKRMIVPDTYRTVRLDRGAMAAALAAAPLEAAPFDTRDGVALSLPTPDGGFETFRVIEAPVMAPELQARYPEIRSYYGRSVDRPGTVARISMTPDGFRALVLGGATYLIDPMQQGDAAHHVVYRKADYTPDPERVFEAFRDERVIDGGSTSFAPSSAAQRQNGGTMRTYRLAMAATGEYTAFHGGTVADGMAAITVAMTRVNGVYERDLSVRMVLVADNDQVVYTDAATDPYSNNDPGALLNENQANLDAVIGSANYDVGHVFTTGGGGLASLGAVCVNGRKAKGETGLSNPTGDPFYIDYVSHELGHQFNANHTFNGNVGSCGGGNRNASTAYEPGSGSTIMAYAGICGSQDIQSNSNDYFHTASLDEIVDFITTGTGSTCGTTAATGNAPPVVSAENDGVTIPVETPFMLRGSATDDGPAGALTYTWEEFDLGPAGPPPGVAGWSEDPPLFRSFDPGAESTRYFPQFDRLLANDPPVVGEGYPMDSRTLQFRLTARDNVGGIGDTQIEIMTDQNAGPFMVTFANAPDLEFGAGSEQEITWDVAGTDGGAVNTPTVDILLSTDNGTTFSEVLAAGTPNDGSEMVTFPDAEEGEVTEARIMIRAVGNIFFDVNDEPFELKPGVDVAFVIDDTGSMGEEIAGVRNGLLAHLASYPDDGTTTFQLVTFKDNVSPRPPTNDLATIQSQVAGLFASGGGDCPEASVEAIMAARNELRDDGRVFLATDADPHPGVDLPGTIDDLRAAGIRVDVILSATCTGEGEFGPVAGTDARGACTSSNDPTTAEAATRAEEVTKPVTARRAYANSVQLLHSAATPLFLGDDDFEAILLPFAFPFGGGSYSTAFVGSNGYVTFGSGDTEYSESVSRLLVNNPRIAPLWDDLNPSAGGQITVEEVGGNAVITFDAVPEFGSSNTVSFTLTLRPDGTFAVTYGDLGTSDGLAAVHTGGGTNPGPTDLSAAPQPIDADPLGTVYEQFFGGVDLAGLTLEFAAVENGPPPPPPTFGAIAGFSRLALQTGGVFIFLPEVNFSDPLADQAFENAVFNLVQGGINKSLVLAQPRIGPQGSRLQVEVTGAGTSFQQGATDLMVSGTGVTVESITVLSPVRLLATLNIASGAPLGFRDLEAVTTFGTETETALGTGAFQVTEPPSGPTILSIAPAVGAAGATLSVHVFGANTNFDGSSELQLGSGITVLNQTVLSATELEATLQIASTAPVGFRDVLVVTGPEVAVENMTGPFFVAAELPAVQATLVSATPSVGTRGTDVTLSVTGLNTSFEDGVSALSLSGSGTETLSTSVTSPTELTAVVRIDAAAPLGARDVRVTTGAEVAVLLDGFVITNSSDCPTDLVISDFQAAPDDQEFVDLQNVGTETIDFATVDCTLGAFTSTSYLGLPASGTLAPGGTLRFGASGAGADVAFPDGTLRDGYSGLALLDRESLANGTSIPTVQPDIVTSLVYLSGGTVYGFFHVDPDNAQLYCEAYAGELHPYGQSQCAGIAARGAGDAKSGAETLDFASMVEAAQAEQARSEAASIPTVFALHAAYPNPLRERATLGYDLPEASEVRVVVYDVLGRAVAVLVDEAAEAGRYEASFDASGLASGTYVVRMTAEAPSRSFAQTQRFTVVR